MPPNRSLSSGMDYSLPTARSIKVDTRGAVILNEESPEVSRTASALPVHPPKTKFASFSQTRDSRGIYLPNYIEPVSHIAVDVRWNGFIRLLSE